MSKRLTRIAYHEAGHAVMAHDLRQRIKSVSIVVAEESLGRVMSSRFVNPDDPDAPLYSESRNRFLRERAAMVLLAGDVAEHLFNIQLKRDRGADHDWFSADTAISDLAKSREEADVYLAWLWERDYAILKQDYQRVAVEALVQALLQRRRIGAKAVHEIIRSAQQRYFDSLKQENEQ